MRVSYMFCMLGIIALSCTNGYKTKYPYTIRDYSDSLQPYLLQALTLGVPGYDSARHFLDAHTSTTELKKLTRSEHPPLRMLALLTLIYRKGIDQYPVIMDHLDDSAMVATNEGEWGIGMKTVTDCMLAHASWETKEKQNEAVDILLFHHNTFHCAYTILRTLELKDKYYSSVKEMVQRDNRFYETETGYANWYLAQFQKKEDIPMLIQILDKNIPWLGDYSFKLMEQYPDERYLAILEVYAKHYLRRDLHSDDYHFYRPPHFYKAVAVYKNKKAADILMYALKIIPEENKCDIYRAYNSNNELYEAICENSCDAYKKLIPIVEPVVMKEFKNRIYVYDEDFEKEEEVNPVKSFSWPQ